jgi:hypothetical protein
MCTVLSSPLIDYLCQEKNLHAINYLRHKYIYMDINEELKISVLLSNLLFVFVIHVGQISGHAKLTLAY